MRSLAFLIVVGACNGADHEVRVERQASKLAQATEAGWQVGSTFVVGTPGTFTFPHYVALRISLVEGNGGTTPLPIESVSLELHGLSAGDFSIEPSCDALACTAELTVLEAGSTMIEVIATGPDDSQSDCFYYAVHEAADPATSDPLRTQLEAQQAKCRSELAKN